MLLKLLIASISSPPIKTLSGFSKSFTAVPSARNSGLDKTEKVFEISRVEEVIGEFIQLKKSGSNYKGLSPFTNEKTPSFMISPSKQIWKDFSSGKGGNIVAFLMEHEQLSYPQAIKFLAKMFLMEKLLLMVLD